jgi:hypothetical protein
MFARRCDAHVVEAEGFLDIDPRLESFMNINEPADFERMIRRGKEQALG